MRIDVGGQEWTIESFDPASRNETAMGRCDSKLGTISLSSDMPPEIRRATLIHEWLHGVLDVYGVEQTEGLVSVIASELHRQGFEPPVKCEGEKDES